VIKAKRMRWTRHVVSMGETLRWRNLSERNYFGDLDRIDGRIILKIDLKNKLGRAYYLYSFGKSVGEIQVSFKSVKNHR
jgi:hypothetical protein